MVARCRNRLIDVACQGLGIAANAEGRGSAGNDDGAEVIAMFKVSHHLAVLAVHLARPGVMAMRTMQPHGCDRAVHLPADRRCPTSGWQASG
jgi:hypothetical protein